MSTLLAQTWTVSQNNAGGASLLSALGCFAVSFIVFTGLFVWSMIWVYRDAEARGKPGIAVAVLCAFIGWPLSLFAWAVFRPETKASE